MKIRKQNSEKVRKFVEDNVINNDEKGAIVEVPEDIGVKEVGEELSRINSLKESIKVNKHKIVRDCIMSEQPRLERHPHILDLLADIIVFRIDSRKQKKVGDYVKATVNQISAGINIPLSLAEEVK
jgi:hypothetical protein